MFTNQRKKIVQSLKQHKLCDLNKNNAGFSLIELMVTVAIMAVVIGLFTMTMYIVSNANARKAATEINSAIDVCREKAKTNYAEEWKIVVDKDKECVSVVKVILDDKGNLVEEPVQTRSIPGNIELFFDGDLITEGGKIEVTFSTTTAEVISTNPSGLNGTNGYYAIGTQKSGGEYEVQIYTTGKHVVKEK